MSWDETQQQAFNEISYGCPGDLSTLAGVSISVRLVQLKGCTLTRYCVHVLLGHTSLLFYGYGRACLFQLLLSRFGLVFADIFIDCLRCAFDQFLGLS
jgi:hypothetical protein